MRDIATRADIDEVLRAFYAAAFADDELGPIFIDVVHMDLETHMPAIGAFWEKVLLNSDTYRGNAMRVHQDLNRRTPLTAERFERWLALWATAVDSHFAGPIATDAKAHATRISEAMLRNMDRRHESDGVPTRALPLTSP